MTTLKLPIIDYVKHFESNKRMSFMVIDNKLSKKYIMLSKV